LNNITGAQAIVKCLEREGIETVFGIPGLYSMPIFDALYHHPRIRVYTVRHEQGAAFMADGYARATGKPAAILLLPGPGVTNAMTGIGEAFSDSSPVLVLATQVDRAFIDKDAGLLHEMTHQFEMLLPLTKFAARVTTENKIASVFHNAMETMLSGRPRPVMIEIPYDIQRATVPWQNGYEPLAANIRTRLTPPEAMIAQAIDALHTAQKPLIIAGGGVVSSNGTKELVTLAERLGAPVITTGMGVSAIPGDHPLACGVSWIASADMRPLVAASDLVLAVGTRFNQGMTHGWDLPMPPKSIRIDIDPDEIRRNIPVSIALVGDAKATLHLMNTRLETLGIDRSGHVHPELAKAQASFRQTIEDKVGSTKPWRDALRNALPRETIFSCDMSLFWADMLAGFPIYQPRTMLFPWGFGTLGFALPEAIGAKIGNPGSPVVAIAGDGAFLFTGTELATAVRYKLNIPIIIPNNNTYGMIKVQQRDQYDEQFMAVDLTNPDFVNLARAYGANGTRVTTPDQLSLALETALNAETPTIIEIPWKWTWGNEE